MSENTNDKTVKAVEEIKENALRLEEIKKTMLDNALSGIAQSWTGESADKFWKKGQELYSKLEDISSGLEKITDDLLEKITE